MIPDYLNTKQGRLTHLHDQKVTADMYCTHVLAYIKAGDTDSASYWQSRLDAVNFEILSLEELIERDSLSR